MARRCLLLLATVMILGCAPKKVVSYRFVGCAAYGSWKDDQGLEHISCDCTTGKQIGWDAKTGAAIIKCGK